MKKERVLWGILFILGAIFLLLSRTEFMQNLEVNIWTIFWTITLIIIMIKSIFNLNFFGIFIPIPFLYELYDEMLYIEDFGFWTLFFATLLLSIGCNILFPKKWKVYNSPVQWNAGKNVSYDETFKNHNNEYVSHEVNFSSCIKYVDSDCFKSGRFESNFGSLKVYFNNTVMLEPQATAFVASSFGSLELYIPKEWIVVNQIKSPIFGEVREKGYCAQSATNTLFLKGECNFGKIDIFYI